MSKNQIIYITDPLCLWCYGIAPELEQFYASLPEDVESITINGGLFPNHRGKLADAAFRDYLKKASEYVTQKTGQVFTDKFWSLLETKGFIYDTEPSARASVTVKNLKGDAAMQQYIHALQHAVFVEGLNPTSPELLAGVAQFLEISQEEFLKEYHTDDMLQATRDEYEMAQRLGVQGFPALLYAKDNKGYRIASGYASLSDLKSAFNWARGESGQTPLAESPSCNAQACNV